MFEVGERRRFLEHASMALVLAKYVELPDRRLHANLVRFGTLRERM